MNKPYLLIAGEYYYPGGRTSDWKGCFETREAAEAEFKKINKPDENYYQDHVYDWSEIVDLREWTK